MSVKLWEELETAKKLIADLQRRVQALEKAQREASPNGWVGSQKDPKKAYVIAKEPLGGNHYTAEGAKAVAAGSVAGGLVRSGRR